MAHSLDDVLAQLRVHGLEPPLTLQLKDAFHKVIRWRPQGQKGTKKAAWMRLHSWVHPTSQREYISGAFGIRNEVYTIEASVTDLSPADRAAEQAAREAARKVAEQERAKDAEEAARKAQGMWERGRGHDEANPHPYLARKQVKAFGLQVLFGKTLMVPIRDVEDKLHGLQYIDGDGGKRYGTSTVVEAHFHLIGKIEHDKPIAFGEGYATCATGHMATGWPVVTCFDSRNLEIVIGVWRKLYPDHQFVTLADDDRHLVPRLVARLFEHGIAVEAAELKMPVDLEWDLPDGGRVQCKAAWKADANGGPMRIEGTISTGKVTEVLRIENAGMAKAMLAFKRHAAKPLVPPFDDADGKSTDWNDFHVARGLEATKEALLKAFDAPAPEKKRATGAPQGEGKKAAAKEPPAEIPSFLNRYTLIYGTTTVWDAQERAIIRLESVKAAFGKTVDWWLGHPERRMVSQANVVFDPTGKIAQSDTHVNLFDGLEIEPDPNGKCDLIKAHLFQLCNEDDSLYNWVIRWLALPLQQPGAKMRTSLIIHGRMEGTGKSLMMDIMRAIYGRYSRSITQVQLQSEFNGWQSGMLFCVAEEVVSASERKNLKNLIQNMITNPVVQINEKNMPVREEKSFANFVFLSNEQLPMLLNETDRRYTVLQVERVHDEAYFQALGKEMAEGGVEAFYHWLLNYDLEGFNEHTRPFETLARTRLITLGMQPDQRFMRYWSLGHAGVPFCTCTARDLYAVFRSWCRINGERFIANQTQFGLTASEVLERMGAPPKRSVRYDAYSATQVDKGNLTDTDVVTSPQQGVVYFIPGAMQKTSLAGNEPTDEVKNEDCTDKDTMNKRIRFFQMAAHAVIDQARRSF